MNFSREELWDIRERANDDARTPAMNSGWRRAYQRLADAADALDAFIARSSVGVPELAAEEPCCQVGKETGTRMVRLQEGDVL